MSNEHRWYAAAAVIPVVITQALEHYRWHTERRDKKRKRDFERHMNKAIDAAIARDREQRQPEAKMPTDGAA